MKIENISQLTTYDYQSHLKTQSKRKKKKHINEQEFERILYEKIQVLSRL
jgi:hypothetical protein